MNDTDYLMDKNRKPGDRQLLILREDITEQKTDRAVTLSVGTSVKKKEINQEKDVTKVKTTQTQLHWEHK